MKNSNQILSRMIVNILLSFVISVVVISSVGPFLSWTASDFIPVCFLFFIVYSFFSDEKFNILINSEEWVKEIISKLKGIVLTFLITVLVGSVFIFLIYLLLTKSSGMDRESKMSIDSALKIIFFLFWVVNISSILLNGIRIIKIYLQNKHLSVFYDFYSKSKSYLKNMIKGKKEIIQLTLLIISTFFIFSIAWDLLHPTQGANRGDLFKAHQGEYVGSDENLKNRASLEIWVREFNDRFKQDERLSDRDDVTNSDSLIRNWNDVIKQDSVQLNQFYDEFTIDLIENDYTLCVGKDTIFSKWNKKYKNIFTKDNDTK